MRGGDRVGLILLILIKKYAEAQLNTVTSKKFMKNEFRSMINYETVIKEIPRLDKKITEAMQRVESHIAVLPIVLTHGDFNPHNILENGVIDWERASYAPLGYDLATNISHIFFFPLNNDFIFCRAIWSVVRMDRWPKIQQWRYSQYEMILDQYLKGNNLTEFLFKYQQ